MESIGGWVVAGIFLIIMLPIFLNMLRMEKKHYEITGGVINYDMALREFWYFSENNIQQLLDILDTPGTYEDYAYRFDRENMTLSLTNILRESTTQYILIPEPREDGTRIRLYRKAGPHGETKMGTGLVFYEDFFCKDILNAEPIPYGER